MERIIQEGSKWIGLPSIFLGLFFHFHLKAFFLFGCGDCDCCVSCIYIVCVVCVVCVSGDFVGVVSSGLVGVLSSEKRLGWTLVTLQVSHFVWFSCLPETPCF